MLSSASDGSAAAAEARRVEPLPAPLRGELAVPGDKSISHRAVLFAAMAEGTSQLSGVLDSDDVRSSIAAVQRLGASAELVLQPDGSFAGEVTGWGACGPVQPDGPIDCGNSGTTVRLLMGILSPWDIEVELTGDASLCRRPMRRITSPLASMGARFLPEGRETLPLTVRGTRAIAPATYESPVASAQLKTAVLLAGLSAHGETSVWESAPSRNHTELMLPGFGAAVGAAERFASVTGPCVLSACDVCVPGDPSSAAFPACAAVLRPGSSILVRNVSLNPGRIGFVRVLERMGAAVRAVEEGSMGEEPIGAIEAAYTANLHGCEVKAKEIASLVDEIPVLALVAACAEGTTVFREAGELRVKETDRFAAIIEGLALLGVRAWADGDDLCIEGAGGLHVPSGLRFASKGDHRLAMTWALVGLCGQEAVEIEDFGAVSVSYPRFMEDMERMAR